MGSKRNGKPSFVKTKRGEIPMNPLLERILAAKRLTRLQLARLPVHEKIEILVEMQKTAWALNRPPKSRCVHVWKI